MATILEEFAAGIGRPAEDRDGLLAGHLLDTLGAWLAGLRTEDSHLIAGLVAAGASHPAALDGGLLDRIALRVAQIRNTEIDDIHMGSCTTPGSVVVPVALSLVAALGTADAARFARGLAAGYAAMNRLSLAVSGATILYRGVWPTYFTAPFGAAATSSALLGLDAAATADALAIALTLTSGTPGGHSEASPRWILLGQAARAGVFAALAAAKGYHGDRSLLDGDWLQRTHGIACESAPLRDAAAAGDIAAVSFKPYCCAKQGAAALDGFRQLMTDLSPDEITAVRIAVPPAYAGMIGHGNAAKGRVERITSAPYQMALAAYRPDMLDDVLRPDLTREPKIAAFLPRVSVAPDPALAPLFPARYPARVEIALKDGRTLTKLVTDATGDPGTGFSEPQLRQKFRRLAAPAIEHDAAEDLARSALAATKSDQSLGALSQAVEGRFALSPGT